jgi:hypothetical protein
MLSLLWNRKGAIVLQDSSSLNHHAECLAHNNSVLLVTTFAYAAALIGQGSTGNNSIVLSAPVACYAASAINQP